ncbi:MAG: hypothetical protein ACFFB2_10445 [Promethearchaeota archaeon]
MIKLFAKSKAFSLSLLLIIVISCGLNHPGAPIAVKASTTKPNTNGGRLVIDLVNIEAKVQNKFVSLEELISEAPSPEFQENPLPQLLNGTSLRINASYSTAIGDSIRLAIHEFAVDIYTVISGENDILNRTIVLSLYYDPENTKYNIIDFVLQPNSSKSEVVTVPALELVTYGIYKFVFRVKYHIYQGDEREQIAYYYRNVTFELVRSYPTPPYILVYLFFGFLIIFIALILFGKYGDRRYKQIS